MVVPLPNTKSETSLRISLLFASSLVSSFLLIFGIAYFATVSGSQRASALAIIIGGGIFAIGAVGIWKPELLDRLSLPMVRSVSLGLLLAWLACGLLIVGLALVHAVDRYDESAYLLSGLALRGYSTPYAAHRAPITHVLAAVFADVSWLLNPTLLLGLAILLTIWAMERWGQLAAAMLLVLLISQNTFLNSIVDVMAELPATLFLLIAFYALAKEHFFKAGSLFALTILARWNLGVILVILTICIGIRFGRGPMLRYALGGTLIMLIWLGLSFSLLNDPLGGIYRANFLAAYEFTPSGQEKPDFLRRSMFYLPHFFFLTPLGFLAMALRPVFPLGSYGSPTENWVVKIAIPISFLCYAFTMLHIGATFSRFMAPMISLAMLVLTDTLMVCSSAFHVKRSKARLWILIAVCLTLAWGVWPASILLRSKGNIIHRDVFSQEFRVGVSKSSDKSTVIFAPTITPIAEMNGQLAMWELRRRLVFPDATYVNTRIRLESNVPKAVADLAKRLEVGSLVVVPTSAAGAIENGVRVVGDFDWSLYRITALAIDHASPSQ